MSHSSVQSLLGGPGPFPGPHVQEPGPGVHLQQQFGQVDAGQHRRGEPAQLDQARVPPGRRGARPTAASGPRRRARRARWRCPRRTGRPSAPTPRRAARPGRVGAPVPGRSVRARRGSPGESPPTPARRAAEPAGHPSGATASRTHPGPAAPCAATRARTARRRRGPPHPWSDPGWRAPLGSTSPVSGDRRSRRGAAV